MLSACKKEITSEDAIELALEFDEVSEIVLHQPVLDSKAVLISSEHYSESCNKLKSEEVYKVTFVIDSPYSNALEDMPTIIDAESGKGCFNPEGVRLAQSCMFQLLGECVGFVLKEDEISFTIMPTVSLEKVSFSSPNCKGEVVQDVVLGEEFSITLEECDVYVNYGPAYKQNVIVSIRDELMQASIDGYVQGYIGE